MQLLYKTTQSCSAVMQSVLNNNMPSPFNSCSMTKASASYDHDLLFRSPSDRIASYLSPSALALTKLVVREKMGGSAFDSSPPSKHPKAADVTSPRAANNKIRSPKDSKKSYVANQRNSLPKQEQDTTEDSKSVIDLGVDRTVSGSMEIKSEQESKECEDFSRQRCYART